MVRTLDIPWGLDDRNNVVRFDVVMSVSSIVNRQTNGQYLEMVASIGALKECRRVIVRPSQECYEDVDTEVYSGTSGELITRLNDVGEEQPILCSYGFAHVWAMGQKTVDKQHYTHEVTGANSISPPMKRS